MRCNNYLQRLVAVLAVAVIPAIAQANSLLTIGPDSNWGTPNALYQLPTTSSITATPLATLLDGSIGFNGGLAYNTTNSLLYAIGNDSSGGSTLYSMTKIGGSLTSIGSLGFGFLGGLAFNSANNKLYAIGDNQSGGSALYEVNSINGAATLVGNIGVGFYGGLTYDSDNDLLYAVAGDQSGVMRSIFNITTTATTTSVFDLGDGSLGFNGGLAYDDAADLFYIIGNDISANSTLYSFNLSGASTLALIDSSFGQGFHNVGLALLRDDTPPPPVSEPATLALLGPALLAVFMARRRSRQLSVAAPQ